MFTSTSRFYLNKTGIKTDKHTTASDCLRPRGEGKHVVSCHLQPTGFKNYGSKTDVQWITLVSVITL